MILPPRLARFLPPFTAYLRDLADLVAPHRCAACRETSPRDPPLCDVCRAGLLPAEGLPPGVWAPYAHGGPLARAIYHAKYDNDPALARALGALLASQLEPDFGVFDRVVPVPLHPARLRMRGYNQAYALALPVARSLGARCDADSVVRVRAAASQTTAGRSLRADNVRGAFAVVRGAALHGQRVLVVDDVCTTGATLGEVMAAIGAAGATEVRGLALAHAPRWNPL